MVPTMLTRGWNNGFATPAAAAEVGSATPGMNWYAHTKRHKHAHRYTHMDARASLNMMKTQHPPPPPLHSTPPPRGAISGGHTRSSPDNGHPPLPHASASWPG
jgi:hypothetical protein